MPFTLAHPVAVLPLARCTYLHFPALVLGSMSPDFVYFLAGKASHHIGHTWLGAFCVNLPLCVLFYIIYRGLWRDVLRDYLPNSINAITPNPISTRPIWLTFPLSALLGMATHVFLDAFTHQTGYFVLHFNALREIIFGLAIFKWLQYSGGVLGLLACIYWIHRTAQRIATPSPLSAREKWQFWGKWAILSLILLLIWQIIDALTLGNVATWVIRAVDCGVIALCVMAINQRFYLDKS